MENTNVQFVAVNLNKTSLENTEIQNGAVYFVEDTKELFYDFGSKRTEVKDILILDTDSERTSILFTPLNKFYFILDTKTLWLYKDGAWYQVSQNVDGYYDKQTIDELLLNKQDKLIAGANIKIEDNKISCIVASSGGNDNVTITMNSSDQLQTVAVKTLNDIIKFDWIGTLAEYHAGLDSGLITDNTVCFVTDD